VRARLPARLASSGLALLATACSSDSSVIPRGQIVLYVTTDAPLPTEPGEAGELDAPPALFDRLLLDVFTPGSSEPCAACSHDFELDQVRVRLGEASVGIVPAPGASGYVARARLFRAITSKGREPPPLSTIDVYAALPSVKEDGIVEATIVLRVEDVGHTLGSLSSPIEALPGAPDPSQISWPRAERKPCSGAPGSDEACVPGGAFWMGHPYAGYHESGAEADQARLVVLSPFYVDRHEVTVAEYRASALATLVDGSSVDPELGHADSPPGAAALTPYDDQFYCTYSDAPLGREDLPLNCISWTAANIYCAAQGKRLPSEAEYEYMASGLRSDLFVWGSEADVGCTDIVHGRARPFGGNEQCLPTTELGGPLPAGNGARDRLALEQGEVLDLMGNVSEWTRDYWNRISEPCWAGRSLLENPECTVQGTLDVAEEGDLRTVKGQPWAGSPFPAATRRGAGLPHANRGFRCVRSGN
jgi:formylglycine-generating enzyme